MKTRQFVVNSQSIPKTVWTTLFDSEVNRDASSRSLEIENSFELGFALQNITANTAVEVQILHRPHPSVAWQAFAGTSFSRASSSAASAVRYCGKQSIATNLRFDQVNNFTSIATNEVGFLTLNLNGIRSLQIQARVTTASIGATASVSMWCSSMIPGTIRSKQTDFTFAATSVTNTSNPAPLTDFDSGAIAMTVVNNGSSNIIAIPANTLTGQTTQQNGITWWGRFAVPDEQSGSLLVSPWCWLENVAIGWNTPNVLATTVHADAQNPIIAPAITTIARFNLMSFNQIGVLCHAPAGTTIRVLSNWNG